MSSNRSRSEDDGKDRAIIHYPKAFYIEHSPYKSINFHPKVRDACSQAVVRSSTMKLTKAVLVGDVAVGKTSLVHRFCHNCFDRDYRATIGVDFEVEKFSILSVPFSLQIWDTAGQERFKCIAASYYRGANAILVTFDLGSIESLRHARQWMEEACEIIQIEDPLRFLIGAKKDLITESDFKQIEYEALNVASDLKAEFWATSSKSGENVHEFFFRLMALLFDNAMIREQVKVSESSKKIGDNLVRVKVNQMPDDKQNSKLKCCK